MYYSSSIFDRNRDIEHIVNAAAGVGRYGFGGTFPKRLALLVATDIHRCQKQLIHAVDYLNGMDALDAGICLGDIQGANFTENDGSWYFMAVNKTEKPVTPMTELQTIAFAIQELALYLDTHRDDKEAYELYCQFQKLYQEAKDEYEKDCGPLTHHSRAPQKEYKWLNDPWPWEYAKNREA